MREKRFLSKQATCTSGITPACAGKTSVSCLAGTVTPGSPPRVREKPTIILTDDQPLRITPASAGKTEGSSSLWMCPQDYPRICGKNSNGDIISSAYPGSPPSVREKPDFLSVKIKNFGITPACAGKTRLPNLLKVGNKDHPRECGKNLTALSKRYQRLGSPPRVREKPITRPCS